MHYINAFKIYKHDLTGAISSQFQLFKSYKKIIPSFFAILKKEFVSACLNLTIFSKWFREEKEKTSGIKFLAYKMRGE
jgi:hypothetical protein